MKNIILVVGIAAILLGLGTASARLPATGDRVLIAYGLGFGDVYRGTVEDIGNGLIDLNCDGINSHWDTSGDPSNATLTPCNQEVWISICNIIKLEFLN